MANLTNAEKQALVSVVLGEARGEGRQGMTAVAQVIKNRVNSGKYPSSPVGVISQPHQFSAYSSSLPTYGYKPGDAVYDNALSAIEGVFNGSTPDNTGGALQYHADYVNPGWSAPYGTKRIGNQIFYPQAASASGTSPVTEDSLLANYVKSGAYKVDPGTYSSAVGGPPTKRSVQTIAVKGDTTPPDTLTNSSLQDYVNSGRYAASGQSAIPDTLTNSSLQDYVNSGRYAASGQAVTKPQPAPSSPDPRNNTGWASLLSGNGYSEPTLLGNGGGGSFKTGNGISGTAQLPAGVRPNVTIPSASPSWANTVNSLTDPTPIVYEANTPSTGYTDKSYTERLPPSAPGLPANYGTASTAPVQPRTITQQVTNPAYTKWAQMANIGADDPYQNAAFAYAMRDAQTPAPPKTIPKVVANPDYVRPPLAVSAGFGMSDPDALSTKIGNWFGGTPLGHIASFLQGQQPVGKPGLLGGLTGMMGGFTSTPTTAAEQKFYNTPTPQSLTEGGFNG